MIKVSSSCIEVLTSELDTSRYDADQELDRTFVKPETSSPRLGIHNRDDCHIFLGLQSPETAAAIPPCLAQTHPHPGLSLTASC
ncbi:hypothetical protein HZ326_29841 [Fusarium oxysporum f. sp. albedinis]|nr:hypothetical protein HZ326_29841 [Fusarium oxysporum f. sp. albedinis]